MKGVKDQKQSTIGLKGVWGEITYFQSFSHGKMREVESQTKGTSFVDAGMGERRRAHRTMQHTGINQLFVLSHMSGVVECYFVLL